MVLSWVWICMVGVSVLCALLTGRTEALSRGVVEGASAAVELCVAMGGVLCLWSGVMEVMRRSGLARALARALRRPLERLFRAARGDREAMEALSANLSANLLGLGNAATPPGLAAARRLRALSGGTGAASDALCMLVVLNAASLQLVPVTVAGVRAAAGAAAPFDILPAVWISSAASVAVGILSARLLARVWPV
ncbi:MAG: spore maturation protein A [Oscillospiraceae bacterium]|nr:spore maturation protein A [Oscillospiraceae bacterium]